MWFAGAPWTVLRQPSGNMLRHRQGTEVTIQELTEKKNTTFATFSFDLGQLDPSLMTLIP